MTTHQDDYMAEVVGTPVARDPAEERLRQARSYYLLWSLAATMCSAFVVASVVQNVDEILGGVPPRSMLLISTCVVGLGIFWSANSAKNPLAALSILTFPVMTLVWCWLSLRMPGTLYRVQAEVGPYYSGIGVPGIGIVTASMASVMGAFWLLGDRRLRWRVRIPVFVVVVAAHILVINWLSGRPVG